MLVDKFLIISKPRFLLNIGLLFLSFTISLVVAFLIAETYLFDKLFYQKSPLHGYYHKGNIIHELFIKPRIKDLILVKNYKSSEQMKETVQILGAHTNRGDQFVILMIGDSYLYGQGVKLNDTVPVILEKKLNKFWPVKVINLSYPGDNLFDDYAKYQLGSQIWQPNIVIFGLGINDLLWSESNKYPSEIYKEIEQRCDGEFIKDYAFSSWDDYLRTITESFRLTSKNMCGLLLLTEKLPQENALYVNLPSLWSPNDLKSNTMMVVLQQRGFHVHELLSYFLASYAEKYPFGSSALQVSKNEGHPSKLVHRIIAEALCYEIVENYLYSLPSVASKCL